ncbi:hypothetical protein JCM24511_06700 [Saitozyma sp. JCM 24511]|nr:hypothetical protein JCM24511_06700 [Saitozyma sp. JCM 24511]
MSHSPRDLAKQFDRWKSRVGGHRAEVLREMRRAANEELGPEVARTPSPEGTWLGSWRDWVVNGANGACVLFVAACAIWSYREGRNDIAAGAITIMLFSLAKALNDSDGLGFADILNRWRVGASMGLDAITSPK